MLCPYLETSFDKAPRGASNKFGEGASPANPNQIPGLTPSNKKSSAGGTDKCVLFNTSKTTSDEDKDQRNGEIDDKQALIPMQSQAPLAKVAETEDTSTLAIDNIVAHVWQRHKQKGGFHILRRQRRGREGFYKCLRKYISFIK